MGMKSNADLTYYAIKNGLIDDFCRQRASFSQHVPKCRTNADRMPAASMIWFWWPVLGTP